MSATRMRISLYLAVFCLIASALPAQSNSSSQSNPPLITSMTLESFEQRAQALGYSTTRGNTDGKPDDFFTFIADGRKIGAMSLSPTMIELFVSFRDGAHLDDLNEWNRNHLETSAFVDRSGDAVLRSNLYLEGGVTEQNLNSFITRFLDAALAYGRFIGDHEKRA